MREFSIYNPEDFELQGSPAPDEAYAVLRDKSDNKYYTAYIYTDDIDAPPQIDIESMEEIQPVADIDRMEPVFRHISMRKDGTIVMDNAENISLTSIQNDILARPSTIFTLEGRYVTEANDGGSVVLYKDLTLEGTPAQKVDTQKAIDAISDIHPDLLKNTHERYGNTFPYFPFGKYFEKEDQMIVFITTTQLLKMDDKLLKGEVPFYQNFYLAEKWDINTAYAVCVLDDHNYKARLLRPSSLLKIRDQMIQSASKAEKRNETVVK